MRERQRFRKKKKPAVQYQEGNSKNNRSQSQEVFISMRWVSKICQERAASYLSVTGGIGIKQEQEREVKARKRADSTSSTGSHKSSECDGGGIPSGKCHEHERADEAEAAT
jgi:hypothetical protein